MRVGVRGLLRRLVRFPAWVYQRQQALWNRVLLAGGWSGLYWICSGIEAWLRSSNQEGLGEAVALLPAQWRIVLAALVFVLGLWRPVAGYAAFIVAVAYPLYLVSIYVMALALAVLVLLAPVMAIYAEQGVLFLALLVLIVVLLAPLRLAPLVPLLVGLWWQGAGSWIGGGAAALWLKLCAGMSGHAVGLWALLGWTMERGAVYERFHAANSLQTVALILEPWGVRLAPLARGAVVGRGVTYPVAPGLYLLFNLLDVCAWAAAAWAVSAVVDHLSLRWAGRGRGGMRSALGTLPGVLLLWAGFVALPSWLGVGGPGWSDPAGLAAQVAWLGLVAWVLDALLRYLHRPVAPTAAAGPSRAAGQAEKPALAPDSGERGPGEAPLSGGGRPLRQIGRWRVRAEQAKAREPSSDQGSDIMIELD